MYPNQPEQQPQDYPPQQPQGSVHPYPQPPTPQAYAQPQGIPQQQTGYVQQQYGQPMPPQQNPWGQSQAPIPQTPLVYEEQPSLVPEGMASIDYLNQISTHKTRNGFTRKQLAFFGGLLLLAFGVLAAFLISNAGSRAPNITAMSQKLVVRTESLADTSKQSQKSIKNQSLSNANSAISVQLSSASSTLTKVFSEEGIDTAKPDKQIVAAESNEELLSKLEDARLSGTFDRVYAREMSYQLQITMLLINDIHTRTKKAAIKDQLKEVYDNLEPLQKQLSEFTDTTG